MGLGVSNGHHTTEQTTDMTETQEVTAMSPTEALLAEITRLKAENAAMLATIGKSNKKLSCKVSEKGAVSVYGLQRFPITLYKDQWKRLDKEFDIVTKFIAENEGKVDEHGRPVLSVKPEKV